MTQPSKPITWAIIGAGQIALDKTLPALLAVPEARVVAVADRDPERLRLALIQAPEAKSYADYHALLADPAIQVVYVALPTSGHLAAVLAAAKAGKHVLCEKPLGNTADEARQMAAACAAAGVRLMTAYMSRFSEVFLRAKEIIASGSLGKLVRIDSRFSYDAFGCYPPTSPVSWRWHDTHGGGPLLDIGIYLVFALREILNDGIVEVSAQASRTRAPASAQADSVTAWFRTANGVPGTMVTTFTHVDSGITFHGSEGRLSIEDCFRQDPTGRLRRNSRGTTEELTVCANDIPHHLNYQRQIEHFTNAILEGTPHRPTSEEAIMDALVLDALAESCRTGKATAVSAATAIITSVTSATAASAITARKS